VPGKNSWILLTILCACTLFFCIRRDTQLERQYTGDLRNRIVGARLQKDGRLPYFYKWSPTDGLRYYDPQNFDEAKVSNITATPFTHRLLYPLVEKQQRSISQLWLAIEYILLLLTISIALLLAKSRLQRLLVLLLGLMFLLTSAWKVHIAAGQYYIIIPPLCLVFYYFFSRKKFLFNAIITGIIAGSLILIRPNIVFFFLPFLLLWKYQPLRYRILFSISVLAILSIAFADRALWSDYQHAIGEQLKSHQSNDATVQHNLPDPHFAVWEGWDTKEIVKEANAHPFHIQTEHSNLFVFAKRILSIQWPDWVAVYLPVLFIALLFLLFIKKKRKEMPLPLFSIALLASCLYMLSDLCSPFYRFQYNAVQWLFPLGLAAACYSSRYKKTYLLLLTGVLLNIIEIPAFHFEHTIGEYLLLFGFIILAFRYRKINLHLSS
jgi:hypothetical protein